MLGLRKRQQEAQTAEDKHDDHGEDAPELISEGLPA